MTQALWRQSATPGAPRRSVSQDTVGGRVSRSGVTLRMLPWSRTAVHQLLAWDGTRADRATQDGIRFETNEYFVSGIFRVVFLDHTCQG